MLQGILKDVTVLDLTQNVAGPYCTQVLGDLGADVIKIERPGRGDDTRDWRPPEIADTSATFLALNRNKRSLCLDLDSPEGVAILKTLVAEADVVIHSLKPGSAESRGFGYADLRALNERLIYCALSAFGSVGPLSAHPGYDPLMQAFTGVMSTTGREGDEPVRLGVSLIDMGTGMWCVVGILGALLERARSGAGMLVEASLMDTGVAWMTIVAAGFMATGRAPRKLGSAIAMTCPYELFPTRDGHVFIAAGNDALFGRVCEGLDRPELPRDPRFSSNPSRVANREALFAALSAATRARTTAESVAALQRVGAPCSELNDVAGMLAHAQVKAADLVQDLPVEGAPQHRVIALPLKVNGERSHTLRPPPVLGDATDAILAQAGFTAPEIERLRAAGTVG